MTRGIYYKCIGKPCIPLGNIPRNLNCKRTLIKFHIPLGGVAFYTWQIVTFVVHFVRQGERMILQKENIKFLIILVNNDVR